MPELIDKAKLLEYLSAIKPDEYVSSYGEAAVDVINHVETYVNEMPTIEPEVRHGRWETWGYVFHGIEWKRCSCCGKCADVSYYGLLDGEIKMSKPAIRGGCGARMDATDTNVGGKGGADNDS